MFKLVFVKLGHQVSLFSELFKKFGRVLLEVFKTIYGSIWGVCWRCLGGFLEVIGGKNYYYLTYKQIYKLIKTT